MNQQHLDEFEALPRPIPGNAGFIDNIKNPIEYFFEEGRGCDPGAAAGCMADGAAIEINFPQTADFPETAFTSLKRVLAAKKIRCTSDGYPLKFIHDPSLGKEEYQVIAVPDETVVRASDADGLRRGIYFLEDRICEVEGPAVSCGSWKRTPFIKHRISRCFFGPTNRAPFFIDELMDDVDYYPEEYLNKLAHEGVNGLWLTMYFVDLPSSLFPEHGKDADKRLAKLQQTVDKCARYGIRIYVFLCEPKSFRDAPHKLPPQEAACYPGLQGASCGSTGFFCTSTEAGRRYLEESVDCIFSRVPRLGGIINIMLGEDNGACVAHWVNTLEFSPASEICPVCGARDFGDIYAELGQLFSRAIHRHNPDAEYIGWFYAPKKRDNSAFMKRMLHIAEKWPKEASLMLNFESGGEALQLGRPRTVFDYSLAYVGPSELFSQASQMVSRSGAKIQVGCSHEDASVPFIPVPENLYEKYKFMNSHGISSVMQCWYFGNYPGLMNKAAGELSFEPFCKNGTDFLISLARPEWRCDAEEIAQAWQYFSHAYREFPANLMFEWYGPLHHCIIWPWYLFPVDRPITPSWLLKKFPEISGDRIGECIGYQHTLEETLTLCRRMRDTWQKGVDVMEKLRPFYQNNPPRLADMDLAAAIGIQIKSACNLLEFYSLREDMLFNRNCHLEIMKQLVLDEISITEEMETLCRRDPRLGYHSEAEGYLFYPEKLSARAALLRELLAEEFPAFDMMDPTFDSYTGRTLSGVSAVVNRQSSGVITPYDMREGISWHGEFDDENLYITVCGTADRQFSLVIEPCRLWTPFQVDFLSRDAFYCPDAVFTTEPELIVNRDENNTQIVIPLEIFSRFIRKGFPMRMNIYGKDFHWVSPDPWPSRLQHGTFNPAAAGWLVFN
ncbi:MAG: hypothetical protein E7048_11870 [Lentisphaerae bacterium]|nr:hypothetical protein [Lentisphaerota bacterium]